MAKQRHAGANKIVDFSQFKILPVEAFEQRLSLGDELLLGDQPYKVAKLIYKHGSLKRQLYKYLLEKISM